MNESTIKPKQFLEYFPGHVFRFIDQTGAGRPAALSREYRKDLNHAGFEAYFTVNGFSNFERDGDCKIEHLTNLNSFFIDIDGRKDEEELARISEKLEPTFVVETMRGYHLYWLLDEGIYKDEHEEDWQELLDKWEHIEENLVAATNADRVVKDATRILRVPGTYYWKKSGDAYKGGVANAPFKTKILRANGACRYTMDQVAEAFSVIPEEQEIDLGDPKTKSLESIRQRTKVEREDFFRKVDEQYPIIERPSFKMLISGVDGTIPSDASRNQALLVLSTMARRAGIDVNEFTRDVIKSGWHGMAKERGGQQEIKVTIGSGYNGPYVFGRDHPIVEWNATDEEKRKMEDAYVSAMKARKERDKVRFSTYEEEIIARHPNLKKNDAGIFFDYFDGVYKMMRNSDMQKIVLDCLYEDMLWNYRTSKNVSDKLMCLLAKVPEFKETPDRGTIANVKNGLLNIMTGDLSPHTPDFVSLVQIPVNYDREAACPTWERVITSWTEGDEAELKATILQQYAGYCLSSSMKYGKALFLVGDGGNGKSTYADTIAMMLGDESTENLSLEDLNQTFGMSALIGKRLNIVEEVTSNYLHADRLKKLVSGEKVTTSMKYKDYFKFQAQAKFIFAVNQMPRVDDSSFGTERRILVVHFKNNFRNRPMTELRFADGLLAQELPGILNWAIKGAKKLDDDGKFAETKEQKDTIQDYREENSSVDGFIAECLTEKSGEVVEVELLYEVYKYFCRRDGRQPKAKIGFTKELKTSANKAKKFQFVTRRHGSDSSKIEGVIVNDDLLEMFQTDSGAGSRYTAAKTYNHFGKVKEQDF